MVDLWLMMLNFGRWSKMMDTKLPKENKCYSRFLSWWFLVINYQSMHACRMKISSPEAFGILTKGRPIERSRTWVGQKTTQVKIQSGPDVDWWCVTIKSNHEDIALTWAGTWALHLLWVISWNFPAKNFPSCWRAIGNPTAHQTSPSGLTSLAENYQPWGTGDHARPFCVSAL